MKLSDLYEKGPIVGAPKGSQTDARMGDPIQAVEVGGLDGFDHTFDITSVSEGIQPSGPGSSNDMVPGAGDALTLSTIADTTKANRHKGPKLPGAEAPTKTVLKTVKKSLDDRPGAMNDIIDEQVESILREAVPRVMAPDYSADYELMDDRDEEVIGVASITHGVIEALSVRNDLAVNFEGHIMSRLMNTIIRDADNANANLAIAMTDPDNLRQKRFLERFGFRDTGRGILKRNAGSVTPPSVISNHQ
jgi:hypothetical protein